MYRELQLSLKPDEVITYLRKSQSDDPTLTVSEVLEKHEIILDEWSKKHLGEKVPEGNKYREVVSGETLKDRPQINLVLRQIESPKIKAVEVVEPQRLTRGDLEDIGKLMKLFKHTNTLIITPQRVYNLKDEYDWDAFERELKRGNEYLEYTKKILIRGKLLSVTQGNYIGSIPPYGYEKTTIIDGKRKCPTLKIKESEANIVRIIFDLYVNEDMGMTNICNYLDDMHIKPPKGEYWSPSAIKGMLENVHYIGKVKWNCRKTVTVVENSEIINTRPKAKRGEYLIYDGKHPPIITEDIFFAAKAKQGKHHRAKGKTKVRNPFASILYCQCGRAMALRTYKQSGQPPRLSCNNQTHCNTGSCLYDEMIDRICLVLEQCIEDFEIKLEVDHGDSLKLHTELINDLERKLRKLETKELSQWEMQSDPDLTKRMPQDIFRQLNAKLLQEKDEVQEALRKAYSTVPTPINYSEKVKTFKDALDALRNPNLPAQQKNRLLKACIERIDYGREKPQRLKGEGVKFGGAWTNPPIEIQVKLKV